MLCCYYLPLIALLLKQVQLHVKPLFGTVHLSGLQIILHLLMGNNVHCVPKRTSHFVIVYVFAENLPFFEILSLVHSVDN